MSFYPFLTVFFFLYTSEIIQFCYHHNIIKPKTELRGSFYDWIISPSPHSPNQEPGRYLSYPFQSFRPWIITVILSRYFPCFFLSVLLPLFLVKALTDFFPWTTIIIEPVSGITHLEFCTHLIIYLKCLSDHVTCLLNALPTLPWLLLAFR